MKSWVGNLIILFSFLSQVSFAGGVEAAVKDFEAKYIATARELDELLKGEGKAKPNVAVETIQYEAFLALMAAMDLEEEAKGQDEHTKNHMLHTVKQLQSLSRYLYKNASAISSSTTHFSDYLQRVAVKHFEEQVFHSTVNTPKPRGFFRHRK